MHCFSGRSLLLLALLALPATSLSAQVLPIPRGTDWDEERRRFTGEALKDFSRMLQDWTSAAASNDPRMAARFYTRDAIMHFQDGTPVEGRAGIERALTEILPKIGQLKTGVTDFAASGNLAYALGRFWYDERPDGRPSTQVTGTYMVVAERQGREWRIRSQLFKPESTLH